MAIDYNLAVKAQQNRIARTTKPKQAAKNIIKQTPAKYTPAQQKVIKQMGFTPSDIPDVRKPFKERGALGKAYSLIFERPMGAVNYAVLQEANRQAQFRKKPKTTASYVGEFIKQSPPISAVRIAPNIIKGLQEPIQVSGSDIASRLYEDPETLKRFGPTGQKVLKSKALRSATGFGLEMLTDPTNLIPLGKIAKATKAIPGVRATGKLIEPGVSALKAAGPIKKTIQFFGGGRPKGFTTKVFQQAGEKAFASELGNITYKATKEALKPQEISKAAAITRGVFKTLLDEPTANKISKVYSEALQQSSDAFKSLAKKGIEVDRETLLRIAQNVPTEAPEEFGKIVDAFRKIEDLGIGQSLVKSGRLEKEVVQEGLGKYTRKLYKGDKPEDIYSDLFVKRSGSLGFGAELGATKMAKNDNLRVLEQIKRTNPKDEIYQRFKGLIKNIVNPKEGQLPGLSISDDGFERVILPQANMSKVAKENYVASLLGDDLTAKFGDRLPEMAFESRKAAGMITDAPLIFAMTVEQGINLASTQNFLNSLQSYAVDAAEQAIEKGFVQMPKTAKYGNLAGKYVPEIIRDDVIGILDPKDSSMTKAINAWKQLKLFSPGNFGSNNSNFWADMVMNSLIDGGPPMVKQLWLYPKALMEYRNFGKYMQEATEAGVMASTWANQEAKKVLGEQIYGAGQKGWMDYLSDGVEKFTGLGIKTPFPGVGSGREAYRYTSEFGKLVQFMHQRMAGKSIKEAADATIKATFDYGRLPVSLRSARDKFMPFLTFKYFAAQLMWDTLINRTGKIATLPKIQRAVEGLTTDKADEENLPQYIKERRGMYIRTPFLDASGNPRYMDVSRIYPMGDTSTGSIAQQLLGNPLYRAGVELGFNRNLFLGQPLWDETATAGEKAKIAANYLISQFGPTAPYMPNIQGENPILKAARGQELVKGNEPQLGYEILGRTTTARLREVNPETQKAYNRYARQQKQREIQKNIRDIRRDPDLTQEQKKTRIEKERQKLQKI